MYYRSYKGKFVPKNLHKYLGDHKNIVYRSLLERRFMSWADGNPNILKWSSEEVVIPYLNITDGKIHRYFPDFFIVVKDKTGLQKKILIEVKPEKETREPKVQNRKTRRYLQEVMTWGKNKSKWEAAQRYCDKNQMQFVILTEKDLS